MGDSPPTSSSNMKEQSCLTRTLHHLKNVTVEPFMFFTMFPYAVTLVTLQNLLMERSCKILLEYPEDTCSQLEVVTGDEQERSVQYGNNLYVGIVLLSTIPAVIVATFLGPWSDQYTRKYPLIFSAIGILLELTTFTCLAAMPNSSPYLFFIGSALAGMSGGFIMALSAIYSYLSDITDEKSRPTRYAIVEFFSILSIPLGTLVGGQVYKTGGYLPVMAIGPCSLVLALLWCILFLKETKTRKLGVTTKQMFRDLFRLDHVKSSFSTCLQPRPGNLRKQIWLLVFVNCSIRIVDMGTIGILFPYSKLQFSWTVTQFSNVSTMFGLFNASVTLILVPILNKKLLLHDAAVGLIGIVSLMAKVLITSVATREEILYYAWFSGCMFALGGIAVRSRLSKLVGKQELGRAFSLLAICEALCPVLGAIMMTQILNSSIKFYPGLSFAIAAILMLPSAAVFIWMLSLPTMSFSQLQEEESHRTEEMKCINLKNSPSYVS